jgi:hypothetical protein
MLSTLITQHYEFIIVIDTHISSMCRLITEPENRLGKDSVDQIKAHPFFAGIDWNNLKSLNPPFIPNVSAIVRHSIVTHCGLCS